MNLVKIMSLIILASAPATSFAEQICDNGTLRATAPDRQFQVSSSGTVTDIAHGLMWRQCIEGVRGESCDRGVAKNLDWAQALNYVAELNDTAGYAGHHDWRAPNIRELATLVELQCVNPAINLHVFPQSPAAHLWTSSPYHFYTHYSWYVDFTNGAPTYDLRTAEKHLRLVRDVR